jgi:NADH-quinone oxidoreductase subunit N
MLVTSDYLAVWQRTLMLDLWRLAPEFILAGTILLVLLIRMLRKSLPVPLSSVVLGGTVAALLTLLGPSLGFWGQNQTSSAFSGLLILDGSALYLRGLLLVFVILMIILSRITNTVEYEDEADFYTLLLGSTIGLLLMVSAQHLAMIFLALEMASLPSYVLSGFWRSRKSAEASLKYVLFGAASAGVALYGISLIVLQFGTGDLQLIAIQTRQLLTTGAEVPTLAVAGLVLLLMGIGFKLAVVPFHFWLPDVFSGATAEVGAYLSVASKIAAVGLLIRLLYTLQGAVQTLDPLYLPKHLAAGLVIIAILTMTLGNLAALVQTNLKRLLAYSTIAHAGYMLLGIVTFQASSVSAVFFYLGAYLLMNLGAFAAVAMLKKSCDSDEISSVQGLLYRSPVVAIGLGVCLLSLLGLPPFAGFVGKFQVFASVYDAANLYREAGQPSLAKLYYVGLVVALFNTLLSAGYYLRVLKIIGLDEPEAREKPVEVSRLGQGYLLLISLALLILGIRWELLTNLIPR